MLYERLHFAPHIDYSQVAKERYRWVISLHDDADQPHYLNCPTSNFYFDASPPEWSLDWQREATEQLVGCARFLRELLQRQPSWKVLCVGSNYSCACLYFCLALFESADVQLLQRLIAQRIPNFTTYQSYFPRLLQDALLTPLVQLYCV